MNNNLKEIIVSKEMEELILDLSKPIIIRISELVFYDYNSFAILYNCRSNVSVQSLISHTLYECILGDKNFTNKDYLINLFRNISHGVTLSVLNDLKTNKTFIKYIIIKFKCHEQDVVNMMQNLIRCIEEKPYIFLDSRTNLKCCGYNAISKGMDNCGKISSIKIGDNYDLIKERVLYEVGEINGKTPKYSYEIGYNKIINILKEYSNNNDIDRLFICVYSELLLSGFLDLIQYSFEILLKRDSE